MKRYTLLYIVGVLCTFMNLSWAYASNPVKEGNVITGHVIEIRIRSGYRLCHSINRRNRKGNGDQ